MITGDGILGFRTRPSNESRPIVDFGGIFGGLGDVEENSPKNRLLGDSTQFAAAENMTKAQIISKTLREIKPAPESADYEIVVAELGRRLPDGTDIKTCEDFRQLGIKCCQTCHDFYPRYEMKLIDLPDGSKAWVCRAVEWTI
jgi:hypothetical protein